MKEQNDERRKIWVKTVERFHRLPKEQKLKIVKEMYITGEVKGGGEPYLNRSILDWMQDNMLLTVLICYGLLGLIVFISL